ncbi:MAG: chemotaxis protein CheW [Candidatus Nanopelagicales bacterium]
MSLFTSAPVPAALRRPAEHPAPADLEPPAPVDTAQSAATAEAAGPASDAGYVLFSVDGTTMAVPIGDVREIARSPRLTRLPVLDSAGFGRALALVDVHGRSVPVVDLRRDPQGDGDVLLPLWRRHAGLVVDHVVAVTGPGELEAEPGAAAAVLPAYARGVVRPVGGGEAVVVVDLPSADRDAG